MIKFWHLFNSDHRFRVHRLLSSSLKRDKKIASPELTMWFTLFQLVRGGECGRKSQQHGPWWVSLSNASNADTIFCKHFSEFRSRLAVLVLPFLLKPTLSKRKKITKVCPSQDPDKLTSLWALALMIRFRKVRSSSKQVLYLRVDWSSLFSLMGWRLSSTN